MSETANPLEARIEAEALGYLLGEARRGAEDAAFVLIDGAGVTASGFANAVHAAIYRALEHLYTEGESITPTRAAELVPKEQQAEVLKALDRLGTGATIDTESFKHHLDRIARQAHRLELANATRTACADLDAGAPPAEAEQNLRAVLGKSEARGLRVWSQAERWDTFGERVEAGPTPIPIDNAFRLRQPPLGPDPDHPEHPDAVRWREEGGPTLKTLLNGGLHPGEVLAIAGPVGVGKSTFALQLADAVAGDNVERLTMGQPIVPVLYVALELDGYDILEMSLARLSCVNVGRLHSGSYADSPAERDRVEEACNRYRDIIAPHLRVMDSDFYGYEYVTLDAVKRQVRRAKVDFGAETAAVFIDPLQRLITGSSDVDKDEFTRTGELAKGLHALAKREGVAVVMLSDSTRAAAGAEGQGTTGELGFRGSYVINHLASTTLYLDIGGEVRELFPELWKRDRYQKFMYAGEREHADEFTYQQRQLATRIEKHTAYPLVGPGYDYRKDYKSQYAALACAKRRWEESFSPIFHYHKAVKCFEELPV